MKHLKNLRKNAGYKTAKEVAIILKISKGMIYQMEEGYKRPSIQLALRIAELYKCTLDDIFIHRNTTNSNIIKNLND